MTQQKTFLTMLTSLKLQKNQLENQLLLLKKSILKKQQSIHSFENYSNEYKGNFYSQINHKQPTYKNTQQFLDKLTAVLYSERQELSRLEEQKMELLTRYHLLNQKCDGLKEMLNTLHQEHRTAADKIEDTKRAELATLRQCQQRMEDLP